MYKIHSVKIDNFWHRFNASGEFNEDVNIIIGRNGTGKTTFMNILHSVLAVDVDGISANDFDSAAITLINRGKEKTVKVEKIDGDRLPFLKVVYRISNKKYDVRIFPTEEQRMSPHYRRRAIKESEEVRGALSKLVSLSSLSVYRLRSGQDYEIRDRHGRRAVSPVDSRLSELLQGLTRYQLDLSQRARTIATKLQRDVLTSILYSADETNEPRIPFNFDKKAERNDLVSAYSQLSAIDAGVRKKISVHVDAIDNTFKDLKASIESDKKKEEAIDIKINLQSLEALQQTRKIIKLSLDAEKETSIIFSQITLFIDILSEFITDKKFSFSHGDLRIEAHEEEIHYDGLSSGEKQLLIIFIETLLQKQDQYIFLTDEPELSLHIAWQRKIIPAIKKLNPNAQIIAATHSPEVASKYRNSIIDMEELIDG
ncbi:MAG: AAA family ATPase [bacterium]|nr:AAA family ATPase [bacterium]